MRSFIFIFILAIVQIQIAQANELKLNCEVTLFVPSRDIDTKIFAYGNYVNYRDIECVLMGGEGFEIIFSVQKDDNMILINRKFYSPPSDVTSDSVVFSRSSPYPYTVPLWAEQFIRMYRGAFQKFVPQHLATYEQNLFAKQKAIDDERARVAQVQADKRKKDEEGNRARMLVEIDQLRPEWMAMNPGQLYAKADEFLAREEPLKAREVLRTLVRRFPEHQLSVLAAQQLSRMP